MSDNKRWPIKLDPELSSCLEQERERQESQIELIASENYASPAVMAIAGGVLTNKYAEGYPGKRYYGGCEYVDEAEQLAIERAKQLFRADYANVQPHSGSQANSAVYLALLQANDTVMGLDLNSGGHLSHGTKVNFSGKLYQGVSYSANPDTGLLDYDAIASLALQHKPKLIIAGFSAYARTIDWTKFREIADSVGAYLLADIAHIAGLIATGLHPSPIGIADVVTTTTHKTLRGPRGGMIMTNNAELSRKLNTAVFPGTQGGPLMHLVAAKAQAFYEALQPEFIQYQQQILNNAKALASGLLNHGLDLVTGGTDNHLVLVDLRKLKLTGRDADHALHQVNITVNKNSVPNDPESPMVTSGIRLGTPALTTRGFKEPEITKLSNWISAVLSDINNDKLKQEVKTEVLDLCSKFPVYEGV